MKLRIRGYFVHYFNNSTDDFMKKIFLIFILTITLISCNSDDSVSQPRHELDGEWNLIGVSCVCPPIYLDIGEHVWSINVANNTVNVVSNVTEYGNRLPETGAYDFLVVDNIVETQNKQYEFSIIDSTGNLVLAQTLGHDAPRLVFTRE